MKKDLFKSGTRAFGKLVYYKRKSLIRKAPERFLSVRQICELLQIEKPSVNSDSRLNLDAPLTIITAWPTVAVKGCLFVQLPDDKLSSADEAVRNGASIILTEKPIKNYPCLVVKDAVSADCLLCAELKRRRNIPTTAVTGSVGKTTTKEMVAQIYKKHYRNVFWSIDNYNMYYNAGYFTQLLPTGCKRHIQEVNEGDPGSARMISKMIEPEIAIITNIGVSHMAHFKDENDLINEVCAISSGMPVDGTVIINGDCENTKKGVFDKRTVSVGVENKAADYVAENIEPDETGISFTVRSAEGKTRVRLNIVGRHNIYNALLAFAAAKTADVPTPVIVQSLARYKPKGIRQNTVKTRKGILLYIDCYNASPISMESAIISLCSFPAHRKGGRRIAVLGNMEELGDVSIEQHRAVGDLVARSKVDVLITYGDKAAEIADRANTGALEVFHTTYFGNLVKTIRDTVKPGDAVLLKASHAMGFEIVLKKAFPAVYYRYIQIDKMKSLFRKLKIAMKQ